MQRRWQLMIGLAAASIWLTGCSPRPFETEGDTLRARVLDLETQVRHLQGREAELQAELRRARRWEQRREEMDEQAIAEFVPHVVGLTLGRLSHARDTTGDGRPDALLLYVHPVDSRGRFTQMVGQLLINAVIVPEEAEAITAVRTRVGPGDLRDSYRSGITGTHYAVQVPLELSDDIETSWLLDQQAVVRVSYIDGLTGDQHTAQRAIDLWR